MACHQNLESDISKAGHPELTFELDGQSVAEPKHWRDDDPSSGLRAWLTGQAVALREMSWALSRNETPDSTEVDRWKGLAWLLAKTTAQQTNLPLIDQPDGTINPLVFSDAHSNKPIYWRAAQPDINSATTSLTGFLVLWQKRIPNLLFRKKDLRIYFSVVLKDLFLRLTDSPLRLPTRAQVQQRILHSHNYSKTFDPAPIFRHRGLLNICEVFARHLVQPSNNIIQRRPVKPALGRHTASDFALVFIASNAC